MSFRLNSYAKRILIATSDNDIFSVQNNELTVFICHKICESGIKT